MASLCSGPLKAHAVRIEPGADLVPTLQDLASRAMDQSSSSAFVLTAVGSLSSVTLRMANASRDAGVEPCVTWNEKLEIVSLVGTFTKDAKHLHMSVSREDGSVVGGHVMSGVVHTTLELVIGTITGVEFQREHDERTGYRELHVQDN